MAFSPTGHSELMQLESSNMTYSLVLDPTTRVWYRYQDRTVFMNPNKTLFIGTAQEFQDPLINGLHEVSHAAEHDRIGTEAFVEALKPGKSPDGFETVSPEEQRATRVEQQIGRELGLPTRKNYQDSVRPPEVKKMVPSKQGK